MNLSLPIGLMIGLLLLMACKEQELPEEVVGTPDFYISGEIGSASLDLQAGVDQYYMFTGYEYDEDEIATFWGEFAPANCQDCPERLRIEIRDFQQTPPGGPVDIDEALKPGEFEYLELPDGRIFRVQFSSEVNDSAGLAYQWDFGDGSQAAVSDPSHTYEPGDTLSHYDVCLQTIDPDGCTTSICNEITLDPESCKASFTHEISANAPNFVIFDDESTGKAPLSYQWEFGDGFGASLGNPGYYYGNVGLFTACLTVTDADGCVSVLCKNIAVDPDLCETNFSYVVESTTVPDTLGLSRVSVSWTDANGDTWSSATFAQPESSRFEILSSAAYPDNEKGEATRRVKLSLDCNLYHDGDTLKLQGAEGFVGLGYP